MESINSVTIGGNLVRDPELRVTQNGYQILSFTIATTRNRKNAAGEWEDYAIFTDCKLFGKRAESLARILSKGAKVTACGKLGCETWEDKNTGAKRSKHVIEVTQLEFMTGAKRENQQQQAASPYDESAYADDDIPF